MYKFFLKVWTSAWTTADVKCFIFEVSLIHTLKTKSGEYPNDIAKDSVGGLLYIKWKTRALNKVENGQTAELIRLRELTFVNLFVTSTGDILVTINSDDITQSKVHYSESTKKKPPKNSIWKWGQTAGLSEKFLKIHMI